MTDYTSQAREYFGRDAFATETTGIVIEEAREGYARCSLEVSEKHLNAAGVVMGGAVFTLADLTFAAAANAGQPNTVSMTAQIVYLSPARGPRLVAEAACVKAGARTCTFTIDVFDSNGSKVAFVTATGHRV